jgi:hypothetical protein
MNEREIKSVKLKFLEFFRYADVSGNIVWMGNLVASFVEKKNNFELMDVIFDLLNF